MQIAAMIQARMNSRRLPIAWMGGILLVLVLTGLMLIPVSPAIQQTPARDSGMFLYSGSQLLQGKILYREVWDHKPPLIFFLEPLFTYFCDHYQLDRAAGLDGWRAYRRSGQAQTTAERDS